MTIGYVLLALVLALGLVALVEWLNYDPGEAVFDDIMRRGWDPTHGWNRGDYSRLPTARTNCQKCRKRKRRKKPKRH